MATKYKSKHDVEISEQKKLVRKNLKKIKSLLYKAEALFLQLPNSVQDNMLEVHNPDYSVNHCVRWGGQAAEQLLEKRNMKVITKDL